MIHSCNIRRNLFMRNKKLLLGIGIMCCLWCLPKIVHGKENKVSFSLVELKCENMVDPLGIDNVTPHLSWKLKGDGVVDGQAFYEIQVASDSLLLIGGKADLWKSGKLKSDVSVMGALSRLTFGFAFFMLLEGTCLGSEKACFPMESGGAFFCWSFE